MKLVEHSLSTLKHFDKNREYSMDDLIPYDAFCDRFVRALEMSFKLFRTYEIYLYGISSDTLRDTLNKMAKLEVVSQVDIWFEMRNLRNKVAHEYAPKQYQEMIHLMIDKYVLELEFCKRKVIAQIKS